MYVYHFVCFVIFLYFYFKFVEKSEKKAKIEREIHVIKMLK